MLSKFIIIFVLFLNIMFSQEQSIFFDKENESIEIPEFNFYLSVPEYWIYILELKINSKSEDLHSIDDAINVLITIYEAYYEKKFKKPFSVKKSGNEYSILDGDNQKHKLVENGEIFELYIANSFFYMGTDIYEEIEIPCFFQSLEQSKAIDILNNILDEKKCILYTQKNKKKSTWIYVVENFDNKLLLENISKILITDKNMLLIKKEKLDNWEIIEVYFPLSMPIKTGITLYFAYFTKDNKTCIIVTTGTKVSDIVSLIEIK